MLIWGFLKEGRRTDPMGLVLNNLPPNFATLYNSGNWEKYDRCSPVLELSLSQHPPGRNCFRYVVGGKNILLKANIENLIWQPENSYELYILSVPKWNHCLLLQIVHGIIIEILFSYINGKHEIRSQISVNLGWWHVVICTKLWSNPIIRFKLKQKQLGQDSNDELVDASTHWSREEIDAILQTFSNEISWMKMCELWLAYHWSSFPYVKLATFEN